MKSLFAVFLSASMVLSASAYLDTTHTFENSDGYWNTSAYDNKTPDTQRSALAAEIDASPTSSVWSRIVAVFSSLPSGLMLLIK